MAGSSVSESYPFIAPEKYAGKLDGKVAIVTGTSSGIGRSVAIALAKAGASVACVARREPELKSLVAEIEASGGHAVPIVADVAARGAAKSIVSHTEKALGPVDILVNNAGITRIGPLEDEADDLDVWWRVHEVNVRAPTALVRAVLPSMLERGAGTLLTVGSSVATVALPVMSAYASSKAAAAKFIECMSVELKGTGVYSFALCPGRVSTELGAPAEAFNKDASRDHPGMQKMMPVLQSNSAKATPELATDTIVAIVADDRYKILDGRQIQVNMDMESVLKEAEKPELGRIGKERLMVVDIGQI